MTINWLWNGIKVDGKLYRCNYGTGPYTVASGIPNGTICVYAKDYSGFPDLEGINIVNDSDWQTDYFEKDRFYIPVGSFHYNAALAACKKQREHFDKMFEKKWGKR